MKVGRRISFLSQAIEVNRFAILHDSEHVLIDSNDPSWRHGIKPDAIAMVYARGSGYVYEIDLPASGVAYGHGVGTLEDGIATAREDIARAKANQEAETPADRLEQAFANHDWFYHYSDSFDVWVRGMSQWREIIQLSRGVDPKVLAELREKYAPASMRDGDGVISDKVAYEHGK